MKKRRQILIGFLFMIAGLMVLYRFTIREKTIVSITENQPLTIYLSHENLFRRYQDEQNTDAFGPPVYLELDDIMLKKELISFVQGIPAVEKAKPGEGVILGGFALEIVIDTEENWFCIGFFRPDLLYITSMQGGEDVWICSMPEEQWNVAFNTFSTYDSGGHIYTMTELFGTDNMATGEKIVGLLEK